MWTIGDRLRRRGARRRRSHPAGDKASTDANADLAEDLARVHQLRSAVGVAVIGEDREQERPPVTGLEFADAPIDLHQRRDGLVDAARVGDDVDVEQVGQDLGLGARPAGDGVEHRVQRRAQRGRRIQVAVEHPGLAVAQKVEALVARSTSQRSLRATGAPPRLPARRSRCGCAPRRNTGARTRRASRRAGCVSRRSRTFPETR